VKAKSAARGEFEIIARRLLTVCLTASRKLKLETPFLILETR
jgi:hypothetical protein